MYNSHFLLIFQERVLFFAILIFVRLTVRESEQWVENRSLKVFQLGLLENFFGHLNLFLVLEDETVLMPGVDQLSRAVPHVVLLHGILEQFHQRLVLESFHPLFHRFLGAFLGPPDCLDFVVGDEWVRFAKNFCFAYVDTCSCCLTQSILLLQLVGYHPINRLDRLAIGPEVLDLDKVEPAVLILYEVAYKVIKRAVLLQIDKHLRENLVDGLNRFQSAFVSGRHTLDGVGTLQF